MENRDAEHYLQASVLKYVTGVGKMMKHFTDNFEGGAADAWELEPGWLAKQEDNNYVLSGEGHSWARLGIGQDWINNSSQFRIKLLRGVIHINYRVSDKGRYFIGFQEKGLYLKKESPWGVFFDLATSDSHHNLEVWHDIEITGEGSHLQVFVDGFMEIDFIDASPLTHGNIAFETLDDSHACVDSVRVSVNSGFILEEIVEANQSLQRYHFRLAYNPGIIYEVEMDQEHGRQYIQIGLTPEIFPEAEVFWDGEKGYGRPLQSDFWLGMQGKPFPNLLQLAVKALQEGHIVSVREEASFWSVSIEPRPDAQRHDPVEFYRTVFGEPTDPEHEEFLEQLIELSQELAANLQMRISREDYLISEVTVQSRARDIHTEMMATFGPSHIEVPPIPDEAPQLAEPDVKVPMEMLLFRLPKIAGWCGANHGTWTQRAIQLIQDTEAHLPLNKRKYTEIYNPGWSSKAYTEQIASATGDPDPIKHHPLVLGGVFEDCSPDNPLPNFYNNWFASDPNYQADPKYYYNQAGWRDYNHFGGREFGLEHRWYFKFRGSPSSRPKPGDRYYSACDWGYGDGRLNDPKHNRLTFTEAIRQYHRYCLDGKRAAYLMLGHAVHLLEDVGQPDHAKLVAHPGSSYTELDAYKKYKYCEIIASAGAAACLAASGWSCLFGLCCAGVWGAVFGLCRDSLSDKKVGYEKLITYTDKWSLEQKNIEDEIKATGVLSNITYDGFFSDLSKFSIVKANITSPLGCKKVTFPPILPSSIGFPGCRPFIHVGDKKQVARFVELTNNIVPRIIGTAAGLIQHFYDIVNYPPYVERVAIVQWEPNDTPRGFAFFKQDKDHCKRYDIKWEMSQTCQSRALKPQATTQPLSPDRTAYFFILFGPTLGMKRDTATGKLTAMVRGRVMAKTKLKLVGIYPGTGKKIDHEVQLELAYDDKVGHYYWGSYDPRNCSLDPYLLTLEISGEDQGAHLAHRQPSGSQLDANPATVARVDASMGPVYPWVPNTYEPGTDKKHGIQIYTYEAWELLVKPKSLVIKPAREAVGDIILQIRQKARDCNWEPYWGPVTCPVEWKLLEKVTKQAYSDGTTDEYRNLILYPPKTDTPGLFGFQVKLLIEPHLPGTAKLVIIPDAGKYTSGRYDIHVQHIVGEPPAQWKATTTIVVELV
jgi:hypothetical protein